MKFSLVALSYALLCRAEDEQQLPVAISNDILPSAIILHDKRGKKNKSPEMSKGKNGKKSIE